VSRFPRLAGVAAIVVLLGSWMLAQGPPAAPVVLKANPGEKHLANIRQLTFGGENAEAYFSRDGKQLIFQSTRDGWPCDEQYTMNIDGSGLRKVSTGQGRTTVATSPRTPGTSFTRRPTSGARVPAEARLLARLRVADLRHLRHLPGQRRRVRTGPPDLDPRLRRRGHDRADGRIVFTSLRDGDMEVYSMAGDGSDVKRLTNSPGPDGGPFYSYDGSLIAWRGKHITTRRRLADFQALLKEGCGARATSRSS